MTRQIALVLLVLTAGVQETPGQEANAGPEPALLAPWPMYGHDARHTGRTTLVGPQTDNVAWRVMTGSRPYNVAVPSVAAVAADGTIYVAILDEKLLALRPDGTFKWAFQVGGFISHLSPAIGLDGTVYIGSTNGILYALNPDGTLRWTFQTGGGLGMVTIGPDGTIYVPSEDGALYAVHPDGTERWRFRDCSGVYPACSGIGDQPVALGADGAVYLHDGGGCIDEPPVCYPSFFVAVNPDGSRRWRRSTGASGGFGPSVYLGTIYLPLPGRLVAFRPDGTVKWVYDAPITAGASIGADGTVYVAAGDGLHAVSPLGIRRWFTGTAQVLRERPAIGGDGTIYVNGDYQDIYAFNADGTLKWLYQIPGKNPAGAAIGPGNRLYVGTGTGGSFSYFYAFGPGSTAP